MEFISPKSLFERLQGGENCLLLDVRTPVEHAEVHAAGVQLMPLDRLDADQLGSLDGVGKDRPIYIFCRSGGRAKQAAVKLEGAGYSRCCVVEGGTLAWAESGLPLERSSRKAVSLERQVRIVSGAIVLTGVLLAEFVNPRFLWIPGFIGAGLIFAGITDWCGMGLLLAKAPWNKRTARA